MKLRTIKRVVVLVLVGVMFAGFAGCSGGGGDDTSAGGGPPTRGGAAAEE